MDAKEAEKKDGLSIQAHKLDVRPTFLHPGYRVEKGSCKWVGTGPLEIIKIICIDDERLFFRGRWDRLKNPAKDALDDALDFDLSHPDDDGTKSEDFKCGKGGWSGHHTTPKLERHPDTRTFEIKIKSPDDGPIFDGTASFTLTTQKLAEDGAKIGDFPEAEVLKGGRVAVLAAGKSFGNTQLRPPIRSKVVQFPTCSIIPICSNEGYSDSPLEPIAAPFRMRHPGRALRADP
jgi:hypothetical protein